MQDVQMPGSTRGVTNSAWLGHAFFVRARPRILCGLGGKRRVGARLLAFVLVIVSTCCPALRRHGERLDVPELS
jgi:hypothetical protein